MTEPDITNDEFKEFCSDAMQISGADIIVFANFNWHPVAVDSTEVIEEAGQPVLTLVNDDPDDLVLLAASIWTLVEKSVPDGRKRLEEAIRGMQLNSFEAGTTK